MNNNIFRFLSITLILQIACAMPLHAHGQANYTNSQLNKLKQKIAAAYDTTKQFVLDHKALLSGIGTVLAGYIGYRLLWNSAIPVPENTENNQQQIDNVNELKELNQRISKTYGLQDIRSQIGDYVLSPYTRQDIQELFMNHSPLLFADSWIINPDDAIIFTTVSQYDFENSKQNTEILKWDLKNPNNSIQKIKNISLNFDDMSTPMFHLDNSIHLHQDGSYTIITENRFDLYDAQGNLLAQVSKNGFSADSIVSDQSGQKICMLFINPDGFNSYIKIIDKNNINNVLFEENSHLNSLNSHVYFSPQGRYVIFHDANNETFIYDLESKKKIGHIVFQFLPLVHFPQWFSDSLIMTGGNKDTDSFLEIYEITGAKKWEVCLKNKLIDAIPSHDRKKILILCDNYTEIWDIEKDEHQELPYHLEKENYMLSHTIACWNKDGTLLAIFNIKNKHVHVWDVQAKKLKYEFASPNKHSGFTEIIDKMDWTFDNKLIYSFYRLKGWGNGPSYPLPAHIIDIPKLDRLMQKVDQKDISMISLLRAKLESQKSKKIASIHDHSDSDEIADY